MYFDFEIIVLISCYKLVWEKKKEKSINLCLINSQNPVFIRKKLWVSGIRQSYDQGCRITKVIHKYNYNYNKIRFIIVNLLLRI